jgi:1A family penicillin-binding protein
MAFHILSFIFLSLPFIQIIILNPYKNANKIGAMDEYNLAFLPILIDRISFYVQERRMKMGDSPRHGSNDHPMEEPRLLRRIRFIKRILASFTVLSVLFISFGVLSLLYLRSQPLPPADIPETSKIYDIHGLLIDELFYGENRYVVDLKKIPDSLVNATMAIEDHRFYDHFGFDIKGIGRAIWVDLKAMALVQGASTITQQLSRNLYLSHDRTWTRKLKEAIYTLQLEMQYSKKDILSMYLNQIYYGHSAYGVQAAAKTYFAKNVDQLSLAESSLLAGIPKGPKYYSPYQNFEASKRRQKNVLQAMVKHEFITQEAADRAYKTPLEIQPLVQRPAEAPYFRDYIKQLLTKKYGIDEETLFQGGLKIYTTLDLQLQQRAENIVQQNLPKNNELQVALIAVDPTTGHIKVMIGGRKYEKNQYNRTLAKRQPGSSFKPILYLSALSQGYTALNEFRSEPTIFNYDGGSYSPSNFGDHYAHKEIRMRDAISQSDNIYAVNTIMDIGPQTVVEMAQKLGIQSKLQPVPSLALGTSPISPMEMTYAYSTIANQGVRMEPMAVLKIEDNQGQVLLQEEEKGHSVVPADQAYILTHLMKSVLEEGGTAHRIADQLHRPAAAKTGTTQVDAWIAGFVPDLVATVWVGYDRDQKIGAIDARQAAPIWAQFMESAKRYIPAQSFKIPKGITLAYIDPTNGLLANGHCPETRLEAFVTGTEPTEVCTVHLPPEKLEPLKPAPNNKGWWGSFKDWWKKE